MRRGLRFQKAGFTLIELMVVVAIIALITVLVMPSIGSYFQISINSTTRNMASIIKEAYNSTVITGEVHRIVYDFKEGQYWVEKGPPGVLLDTAETLEKEARKKRFSSPKDEEEKEAESKAGFVLATSVTRKKLSLPTGVSFEEVNTQQRKEAITEGKAYTHFFPNGFTEQTIVKLKDNSEHKISLVIQPLVGKSEVFNRWLTPEEAFGK